MTDLNWNCTLCQQTNDVPQGYTFTFQHVCVNNIVANTGVNAALVVFIISNVYEISCYKCRARKEYWSRRHSSVRQYVVGGRPEQAVNLIRCRRKWWQLAAGNRTATARNRDHKVLLCYYKRCLGYDYFPFLMQVSNWINDLGLLLFSSLVIRIDRKVCHGVQDISVVTTQHCSYHIQ